MTIRNDQGQLRVVLGMENLLSPYHDPVALDPMGCDLLMMIALGVKADIPGIGVADVISQAYEAFQAAMEVR